MIVAGADPGLDGCIACIDSATERVVAIWPIPALRIAKGVGTKREISFATLVAEIAATKIAVGHLWIEKVSASPQMGVTSAFSFGRGYGGIEGIAAALGWPVSYVTPATWKRVMGVPKEKDQARHKASLLMPNAAAHWTPRRGVMNAQQAAGAAEAALIALYGIRMMRGLRPETSPELMKALSVLMK